VVQPFWMYTLGGVLDECCGLYLLPMALGRRLMSPWSPCIPAPVLGLVIWSSGLLVLYGGLFRWAAEFAPPRSGAGARLTWINAGHVCLRGAGQRAFLACGRARRCWKAAGRASDSMRATGSVCARIGRSGIPYLALAAFGLVLPGVITAPVRRLSHASG